MGTAQFTFQEWYSAMRKVLGYDLADNNYRTIYDAYYRDADFLEIAQQIRDK